MTLHLELNDGITEEYNRYKSIFLKKEPILKASTSDLRSFGINDDTIFIAHMIGVYKASIEMGLV